ncbi:MAG TPA: cytochrome c [Solirubrobacteraceae bacterium]|nr:cytochrome c [Solirubrobacteraceae bacterium]
MGDDDVREPDQPASRQEPDQPASRQKTDQEIFDEQIARASGKFIVQLGGLGIMAALVMSAIALVVAAHRSNTTVTVPAGSTAGQASQTQLKGDALGQQIFVSGTPGGAEACGSCHTMSAAGTSGTTGPNLDQQLTSDPPAPTRESIVNPNKDIATGYRANVMPTNYGTALTSQQLDAVANYVYHSTNTKFKRSKTTP